MTTNQQRAAEVMLATERKEQGHACDVDPQRLREYARDLADAGLIAPDLPESDDGEWEDGRSVISLDDEGFVLLSIDSRPTHPGRARRIAYKILAAAAHAERNQK